MNLIRRLFSRRKPQTTLFDPADHETLMNPELQEAIEALTTNNTSANRRALYERLLETTFCLPYSPTDEEGMAGITANRNEQGELELAAFSDPAALHRWQPKPEQMLVLPAAQLFEVALRNDFSTIFINPAGPAGGKLTYREFSLLAKGVIPD